MGKVLLSATCLLSAVGLTYSCTDDYDLDTTMPGYLRQSIYDELKDNGNFKTTVRLIDDLNYADVLAKTGSKTLFVADDEAYAKFFSEGGNPWGVRSYDELSVPQKKYLLYNAMLNNAYVMEMMSNTQSSGSFGNANFVSGSNLCLRQASAATATDTIPCFMWHELPDNQNQATADDAGDAKYGRFWDWYRNQDHKNRMFLVCDNTTPMMTHFLENNLKYKNITNDDVAFILGVEPYGTENRSYIYDARVKEQDVTCMNGYYNVLDKVLLAPSNMAEMIRTNGETKLFSRILDRFSAPFYNSTLTNNAQTLYASVDDSVFVKRYFSTRSNGGKLTTNPVTLNPMPDFPVLNFDPAWNGYSSSNTIASEEDMAAMFVPSDKALADYFLTGGGSVLMARYATRENTAENLEFNIDQIPLDIISALVNNLMKASFCETVPSKYLTIMNDARDQMFNGGDYPTLDAYKKIIDKCLLANNGVVYVMNRVISPADYASVIAPALYSKNTRVVRTVVRADENFIQGSDYGNAPLQQYFSTYLKAMQSSFTFFVPTDEGLKQYGYVDPASIATGNARNYRYWTWNYATGNSSAAGKTISIQADAYVYNPATGQNGTPGEGTDTWKGTTFRSAYSQNLSAAYGDTKQKLLIEMINQHIIVHDNDDNDGVLGSKRKYFLSRDGAPVYIKQAGDATGNGMVVNGGWQLQLAGDGIAENDHDCKVQEAYDLSKGTNGYGNGHTFLIDRPMQPSMQSVYSLVKQLTDNDETNGTPVEGEEKEPTFLDLCMGYSVDILANAGLRDKAAKEALAAGNITDLTAFTNDDWASAAALYRIFASGKVAASTYYGADQLVRFFNNYRYTVYVPTNKSVKEAIAKGLPTWESIKDFLDKTEEDIFVLDEEGNKIEDSENPTGYKTEKGWTEENRVKAQAMITMLVNFIKYHFQLESVFVDNVNNTDTYQTSSIDEVNNVYIPVKVQQTNGAISIVDNSGATVKVVKDEGKYNLLARDARFNVNPSTNASSCRFIETSSYAVVHQVDNVLNFAKLTDGRYDSAWSSAAKAKKFVKKYQIKK